MRMTRYDHSCTAYELTQDDNGFITGSTVLYEYVDVDVQPLSKSAAKLVELGLETVTSNMRSLFYDVDFPLPQDTILFDNDTGSMYKIVFEGPWEGHLEGIAQPWLGTL